MGKEKITIKCAGCDKTQTLRPHKLIKCDGYFCGKCGFTPPPQPDGYLTELTLNAAGGFWGYRVRPTTPEDQAALDRAKAILEAGLQRLKELN